jgi:hypothetical protein
MFFPMNWYCLHDLTNSLATFKDVFPSLFYIFSWLELCREFFARKERESAASYDITFLL